MTATIQIRPGMTVVGSDGKPLGEVEELFYHATSGKVEGLIVKYGRSFWTERKELSVDLVDRVNTSAGTVEVCFGKPVFQAIRQRR